MKHISLMSRSIPAKAEGDFLKFDNPFDQIPFNQWLDVVFHIGDSISSHLWGFPLFPNGCSSSSSNCDRD
jgi:hypothetical protein